MSKNIVLRNVGVSYPHLFKAVAYDESQPPKYSATLFFPKDHPDVAALKRALFEVGQEKFGSAFNGTTWPKGYTCGLKDADVETNSMGEILSEKNPHYKGCYTLEANSTRRPLVYDRKKQALAEEDGVIYAGCIVNVSLGIAPYEFGKLKKGVKAYLNGVQFVKDGERIGVDASADFDILDGDEDDWL